MDTTKVRSTRGGNTNTSTFTKTGVQSTTNFDQSGMAGGGLNLLDPNMMLNDRAGENGEGAMAKA
jgi:hypothetical protein